MYYYLNSLFRYKLRRFIESIGFRLTIAVLFIADLIIIAISIARNGEFKKTEKHK
jgi:hypothetical protein